MDLISKKLCNHGDSHTEGSRTIRMLTHMEPDICVFVVHDDDDVICCTIDEEHALLVFRS